MIIVRLQGGLGNQMFQYAFGKAVSSRCNEILKFDLTHLLARYKSKLTIFRNYDLDVFNIEIIKATNLEILSFTLPRFNNKYIYTLLNKFYLKNNVYTEKYFNYNYDVNYLQGSHYFIGYWQSFKYFLEMEEKIRKDFILPHANANSLDIANRIASSSSICLNYRRTDYLSNNILNTLSGTDGKNYYEKAIKTIVDTVDEPHFFIFSDDIEWCKNNVKLKFKTTFVEHLYAGRKFANYMKLMSMCKHFIIPNSTYAWWAAWLARGKNKIVVAPRNWFMDKEIDTNDLVPEDWIRF